MTTTHTPFALSLDSLDALTDSAKSFLHNLASQSKPHLQQALQEESHIIEAATTRVKDCIWTLGAACLAVLPTSTQRTIRLLSWKHGVIGILGISTIVYILWPTIDHTRPRKRTLKDSDDDSPDKMMLMRRKKRAGKYTVGLLNPANDCFANSNLQALASLGILYGYISHLALIMPPSPDPSSPEPESTPPAGPHATTPQKTQAPLSLSIALGKTIVLLNEPILTPKSASPWPFLHVLEKFYNSHISRNQHDAHELLHLILETLETEHEQLCKIYNSKLAPSRTTFIPDFPFQGTTLDQITCSKCGYSPTPSQSTFLVFSLMVPQKRSALLTDLMSEVSSPEFIKDYGCTKCRVSYVLQTNKDAGLVQELSKYATSDHALSLLPEELEARLPRNVTSPINKSMRFGRLPQILTIHLSRSIYGGFGASRNSCKVTVVEHLELMEQQSPAGAAPTQGNGGSGMDAAAAQMLGGRNKVTYLLMAMIRHKGTHYAGHYECFRRKNLEWWVDHLPSFNTAEPAVAPTTSTPSPTSTQPTSSDSSVDQQTPHTSASEDKATATTAAVSPPQQPQDEDNHDRLPFPQDRVSKVSTAKIDTSIDPAAAAAASPSGNSRPTSPSTSPQPPSATARFFGPDVAPPSHYEWWKISDDKTWECSIKDVLKEESGAYLLFYERMP